MLSSSTSPPAETDDGRGRSSSSRANVLGCRGVAGVELGETEVMDSRELPKNDGKDRIDGPKSSPI